MVFKNQKQLETFLMQKCRLALLKAQEQVYQIIDRFVKEFYAEFSPEMYERTYQLYRSLVKSDIITTANGYEAQVYFDLSSIDYITGSRPSGEQVMQAADYGRHGAMGLAVADFKGTSIWYESLNVLNAEAINTLKRMLISEGIPIK
jgi:hypothetical protein